MDGRSCLLRVGVLTGLLTALAGCGASPVALEDYVPIDDLPAGVTVQSKEAGESWHENLLGLYDNLKQPSYWNATDLAWRTYELDGSTIDVVHIIALRYDGRDDAAKHLTSEEWWSCEPEATSWLLQNDGDLVYAFQWGGWGAPNLKHLPTAVALLDAIKERTGATDVCKSG